MKSYNKKLLLHQTCHVCIYGTWCPQQQHRLFLSRRHFALCNNKISLDFTFLVRWGNPTSFSKMFASSLWLSIVSLWVSTISFLKSTSLSSISISLFWSSISSCSSHFVYFANSSVHIHLDVVEGLLTKYLQCKVDLSRQIKYRFEDWRIRILNVHVL